MANLEEHILLLTDRFTKPMNDAKGATESMRSSFGGLSGMLGSIAAAVGIGALVKSVFTLGIEAEQTRTSFGVMLGGVGEANKMLGDLAEFANVTPFNNAEVEKSAQTLLQFGVEGDKIIDTLKMLGDTSGGNAEKLQSMTLAFAQIQSAGRLTGQDLLQLINAGFNPLKTMSEKTGKSMAELKKEMEGGNISFGQVEQAFKDATSEGGLFFGMMDKQSKTVGGRISTLQGTVMELGKSIGESLNPALGGLVDFLQSGVGFIKEHKQGLTVLAGAVAGGAIAFGIYSAAMSAAAISTGFMTTATAALNFVMALNPISVLVVAVGALIAAVVVAWNTFDSFRATIKGIWSTLKFFFDNAVNKFKELPTIILNAFKGIPAALWNSLKGVGNVLSAIMTGNFSAVPELMKQLGTDILKTNPLTATALELGKGSGKVFGDAFDKEMKDSAVKKAGDQKSKDSKNAIGTSGSIAGVKKSGVGSGLSEIKSAAPKVFNINIEKLVEKLEFTTNNLAESKQVIKDEITKVLLAAVNDSQIISTQ
jgi:tape measure domain-containing protein